MPQYLTVNSFGGYAGGYPAKLMGDNQFLQLKNMWSYPDLNSNGYYNILSTLPAESNYKTTMPAVGRTRGLFFFHTSVTLQWLLAFQCTTDYTLGNMYALDIANNTWYTLKTGLEAYHMDFVEKDFRLYCCNMDTGDGAGGFYKWEHLDSGTDWENALPSVKDKGGTASAIAGAVLTWNQTTTVTSDIDISANIGKGDWIRKSSTSIYWDEVRSVSVDGLTITLMATSSDTGVSAAGGAQKAPVFFASKAWRPRFAIEFKGKLWLAQNPNTPATSSSILWSLTSDWENWSGLGSGVKEIGDSSTEISGLGKLDDYIFFFKDFSYHVYRWTGDLDEPITFIKEINQGCVSSRTIQSVGNALIYFTGSDLRMTNGNEDVSLTEGNGLDFRFKTSVLWSNRAGTYFDLDVGDNEYPYGIYDEISGIYELRVADASVFYDVKRKRFIGETAGEDIGHKVKVYSLSALPILVRATIDTASNQLKQESRSTLTKHANQSQFSKVYDFGSVNKKKKIYWVEFEFHPKNGCNTVITFKYWDGGETIEATGTGTQTYTLALSSAVSNKLERKRFIVNDTLNQFGWILSDSSSSGTDGWGIVSFTIAFDFVETT